LCSGSAHLPSGDHKGIVSDSKRITDDIFSVSIICPQIARHSLPGQFIMLRLPGRTDPLLGRPFAIAGCSGDIFTVIFKVVGKMTGLLASVMSGQEISVRGPVGNSFGELSCKTIFLVAGTLGAAPLLFAQSSLGETTNSRFILGVPDKTWIPYVEWIRGKVPHMNVFSEDGSTGSKGNVLAGLPRELPDNSELWVCGPLPMMSAICKRFSESSERILVSLEKRMACGMGGCLGCVIDTTFGKRRVCVDGPVFRGSEVCWDELS